MMTQVEIARRVGLDVSSVNKILNRRKGPVFKKETIKQVFKVAKDLGYDFGRLKYFHRRRHSRKSLGLPVVLSIYLEDGKLFDQGTGILKEVSLSGARLSAIVLPGKALPTLPHSIGVRIPDGPLKDLEVLGTPVRFELLDESVGLAVEFHSTEAVKAKRLLAVRA
jgi:transcriptional regulator with XRE-family HTH domain